MSSEQAFLMSCALEKVYDKLCSLLPNLPAADIKLLATILDRVLRAIWRAHGNGIADHAAMLGIETPPPVDAIWISDCDDDPDLPF
jgi:hypothetical protein